MAYLNHHAALIGPRHGGKWLRTAIIMLLAGVVLPSMGAAETAILEVRLNGAEKGEYTIEMTGDRDFFVKREDLAAMGMTGIKGKTHRIDVAEYVSLKSVEGLTFTYNEYKLMLDLTADPGLLQKTTLDFTVSQQPNVYRAKDNSAFLNYGFIYSAGNKPIDDPSFSFAQELGVRLADFLLLSNSAYTFTGGTSEWARGMTSITHDDPSRMERLVIGDFYASSGGLGSAMAMGGISLSKNYLINPFFIKQPLLGYSGFAALPSEVNVLVDGVRIRNDKLPPGPFDLNNIIAANGRREVQVAVKDAFGREQIVRFPFYFTDTLLRKDLQEYSYNIGFLRDWRDTEGNTYDDPIFVAFHRYGFSDSLTGGFRAEMGRNVYNTGSELSFRLGRFGISNVSFSYSHDNTGKDGLAGSFSHTYATDIFSARLCASAATHDYSGLLQSKDKSKYEIDAGIGRGFGSYGSLSVDFIKGLKYGGDDSQTVSLSYSKNILKNAALYLNLRHVSDGHGSDNQILLGMSYYPWTDTTVAAYCQRDKNHQSAMLQVQKSPPTNEGFSYRASVEAGDILGAQFQQVDPYVQYSGRYGLYSFEYLGAYGKGKGGGDNYQLSASGAIASVGGLIAFTRPIYDSFALVKVADLPGVRTYFNNQEVGKTDASGKLIVPNLGAYLDNHITINDKDMPVNYAITGIGRYISPPLRSGTLLKFEAAKTQAFSGTLAIKVAGKATPVEFHTVGITVGASEFTFMTGRDGEFYFENVPQGTYKARFEYKKKAVIFTLTVPKSDEMMIDLGAVTIENEN